MKIKFLNELIKANIKFKGTTYEYTGDLESVFLEISKLTGLTYGK